MAGQRAARPAKRNLVRWTDDMDKKLLLSIQSECNAQGINLPWARIGKLVGDTISGSAVIQHLAKLRARMVQQELSVPPPLKRGGGQRISTGPSIAPSRKTSNKDVIPRAANPKPRTPKKIKREQSGTDNTDSDSDGDYGKPRNKRAKTGRKTKFRPQTPTTEDTEKEKSLTPAKRGIKHRIVDDSSDDAHSEADVKDEDSVDSEDVVAAGAGFLDLVDDLPAVCQKNENRSKSLIVTLPLRSTRKGKSPILAKEDKQATLDNFFEKSVSPIAAVANANSGGPARASIASNIYYDPFSQSTLQSLDENNTHGTSGHLSARPGTAGGLPEYAPYNSMMTMPDMRYPNDFEDVGGISLDSDELADDNMEWDPTNFSLGGHSHASAFPATPFACTPGLFGPSVHSPPVHLQLSTSFVQPAMPLDVAISGEYGSTGPSTINHTPSSTSAVDFNNVPWYTQDSSSRRSPDGKDCDKF